MAHFVIDSKAVAHNIDFVKKTARVPVIAVVKGNGYGLGLTWLAALLQSSGITRFAITEPSDIPALREAAGNAAEILLLRSTTLPEEVAAIVASGCAATIGSSQAAKILDDTATRLGIVAHAYVKIDIGLGRYGFFPNQMEEIIACYKLQHVQVDGIYGHFSHASQQNSNATHIELNRFNGCVDQIRHAKVNVGLRHIANSPALLNFPETHLDAVRVGSAFTGRVAARKANELKCASFLQAPVIDLKRFPKGTPMGYGGAYRTRRDTLAAIVPIGTQDGFGLQPAPVPTVPRALAMAKHALTNSHPAVQIGGRSYPVLGAVDMSLCMVDVTDCPITRGATARADVNPLMVPSDVERIYL